MLFSAEYFCNQEEDRLLMNNYRNVGADSRITLFYYLVVVVTLKRKQL
jgi:hypothetical protein